MKKLNLLFFEVILLGTCAFGQVSGSTVTNRSGQPIGGALIAVCTANPGIIVTGCSSTLAVTYTDETLTVPCVGAAGSGLTSGTSCSNPGKSNGLGNYLIFTKRPGILFAQIYGNNITTSVTPFVAVAGTTISGQFVVDGFTYLNICAAVTAAGATGSVVIPSNYAGTDTCANSNKIQIIDLRPLANRQRGFINVLTDCELKGDGVTDDATALQTCFNNYPGYEFYFPKTQANGTCNYLLGSRVNPQGVGTVLRGSGGGYIYSSTHAGGTEICSVPGVSGFLLDNVNHSIGVEYLSFNGQSGNNAQGTPTLLNLSSAANLPLMSRNISAIQRATQVTTVTITPSGVEGLPAIVGSTVTIAGVTGDLSLNGDCIVATVTAGGSGSNTNPYTFTCSQQGVDVGPFGAVGTVSPATTGAGSADGFRVCGNFHHFHHVIVMNYPRHGINGASNETGCSVQFSDDLTVTYSTVFGNQGFGIFMRGGDSNAGKFEGNNIYYNGIWGAYDSSFLGNTWQSNQASYNALGAASATTPATKTISTVSRTLTNGISQSSLVLSVADTNVKLGSCIVVAGVTDVSFNTATPPAGTATAAFFVNSYTDSTHFGYEQPGAPANASSSGGTERMGKFSECYPASGLDYGSYKIGVSSSTWSQAFLTNYSEGGQACKFGQTVPVMFGVTVPTGCAPTGGDWLGIYFQLVPGLQNFGTNLSNFSNYKDAARSLIFQAGISSGTAKDFYLQYKDFAAVDTWGVQVINLTGGAAGNYIIRRGTAQAGVARLAFYGPSTANGVTRLSSESTGAIQFNISNGDGTGGLAMGDGAGNTTMTVSSAGLGTFNGGVIGSSLRSQTANVATVGAIRIASSDSINARNNANSANITLAGLNVLDQVVIGGALGDTVIGTKVAAIGAQSVAGNLGVTGVIGVSHLTAQTANIGTTTLVTTNVGTGQGQYEFCFYASTTTAGTGTTATVTLGWTDLGAAKTFTSGTFALSSTGNTGFVTGCQSLYSIANTAITYATTVAAIGTSVYALDVWIKRAN